MARTLARGNRLGAYRLVQLIGLGGMGEVWLAEHAMLGRRAAVKLLHPSYAAQPDIVTRFFNEARAATSISDPGIVQIFDFGHHDDGSPYIVMELLDGESLERRLRTVGRFAVPEALRVIRQVATSLGSAHARGIVHRDLKPENVFLVHDPEVLGGERAKILDFGIAKLVGDRMVKTQTSAIMGTPMYMSPEQCRGAGQVDQRSDVYSLGCILCALITGRPPFEAEGMGDVIAMHLREQPPAPSTRVPGVTRDLDELVLKCLAKDPGQRFATTAELARAIGVILGSASNPTLENAVSVKLAEPSLKVSTLSNASGERTSRTAFRARWPLVASAAVVSLASALIVFVARREDEPAVSTKLADLLPDPRIESHMIPQPTIAAPKPAPAEPKAIVTPSIRRALEQFRTWAKQHPASPCPDASTLMTTAHIVDAWGNLLRISCTEQPEDQMVGVTSAGPDGTFGSPDDIRSWDLDHEITDVVRGPRWHPHPPATPHPKAMPPVQPPPRAIVPDIPTER